MAHLDHQVAQLDLTDRGQPLEVHPCNSDLLQVLTRRLVDLHKANHRVHPLREEQARHMEVLEDPQSVEDLMVLVEEVADLLLKAATNKLHHLIMLRHQMDMDHHPIQVTNLMNNHLQILMRSHHTIHPVHIKVTTTRRQRHLSPTLDIVLVMGLATGILQVKEPMMMAMAAVMRQELETRATVPRSPLTAVAPRPRMTPTTKPLTILTSSRSRIMTTTMEVGELFEYQTG